MPSYTKETWPYGDLYDHPDNGVCEQTERRTDCWHAYPHCGSCRCSACRPAEYVIESYAADLDGDIVPVYVRSCKAPDWS